MQLVASEALRAHQRLLAAAFKREIDVKLGKTPLTFVGAVLEPIFTIGVICLWHYTISITPPYGTDMILYISTGIFATFAFVHLSLTSQSSTPSGGRNRRYPVEKEFEILLAAMVLKIITYACVGVLLFSTIYVWRTPQALPWNWSPAFESVAALIMMGFGVGQCNAVVQRFLPFWRFVWSIISRLLFLMSGVVWLPDHLPGYIRDIVVWNPLLHAVTLFRRAFYPQYPMHLYSESYLWGWALGAVVCGLIFMRMYRRN